MRKEKRKFVGDTVLGEVVDKQVERMRRYCHLHLFKHSMGKTATCFLLLGQNI